MKTPHYWKMRDRMGEERRLQARIVADAAFAPLLGSVRSTHSETRVAITFDDGPDAEVTPKLLARLEQLDARCTFFLLATQGRRHPDLVRAVRDYGHEIALHGDDHRRITEMQYSDAIRYLRNAREQLEQLAGAPIRHYRPPYGAQSVRSYLAAKRAGLDVVVWSADAGDWNDRMVEDVAADGLRSLKPGGILLLHERLEPDPGRGAPKTTFNRVRLAELVVSGARRRGWEPVTVGDAVRQYGALRTAWFRP